jgi:hypothetical protein
VVSGDGAGFNEDPMENGCRWYSPALSETSSLNAR